jgi:hypothetical protein
VRSVGETGSGGEAGSEGAAGSGAEAEKGDLTASHLQCPFCTAYAVARLYVASLHMDCCECASCGARWDEECGTGAYKGRASSSSILLRRS